MSVILSAHALRKHYPKVKAVDGISVDVAEGTCLGLLGPNGAGKSTTVEMLEGLVTPTSGEIRFRGKPIAETNYRDRVGIQFQNTALQDFLTVRDNLKLFAALYRRKAPIDSLIEACRLEEFLDRDHRKLSGGQRQRMLLAIALINDPDLVFLDEPTTGLDPQARRNFWELVLEIKRRGTTIVLTTHYMEEAYLLCDEIGIMDHGRMIASGAPAQLLADHFNDTVLELPAIEVDGRELEMPLVRKTDRVEILSVDVNRSVQQLIAAGLSLTHLKIRPRTLEDLYLHLTGTELRS
jgi:ABC-2 type transport system ATP-binding protein